MKNRTNKLKDGTKVDRIKRKKGKSIKIKS